MEADGWKGGERGDMGGALVIKRLVAHEEAFGL